MLTYTFFSLFGFKSTFPAQKRHSGEIKLNIAYQPVSDTMCKDYSIYSDVFPVYVTTHNKYTGDIEYSGGLLIMCIKSKCRLTLMHIQIRILFSVDSTVPDLYRGNFLLSLLEQELIPVMGHH